MIWTGIIVGVLVAAVAMWVLIVERLDVNDASFEKKMAAVKKAVDEARRMR